jgi:signal transduction histidine kinase
MKGKSGFKLRLGEKLLERRWLLIVLLCAFGLIFETIDNWVDNEPFDATYFREVFFFGIIYPVGVGWLLTTLLQARTERDEALQQQKFIEDLMAVPNWNTLLDTITYFPQTVAPVMGTDLFLPSIENGNLTLAADWSLVNPQGRTSGSEVDPITNCGVNEHISNYGLHPFTNSPQQTEVASHGYCLPLFRSNDLVGLLQMQIPSGKNLTTDQIRFFNRIAPAISSALESLNPDDPESVRTTAARLERERIARQLHDTLGQSLSYLRSKLDQLNMDDMFSRIASIQKDLDRMRDISNDAYEQIRQNLLSLQPEYEGNFSDTLHDMAFKSAERGGFELQYRLRGESRRLLSSHVQRKLLLILREAINNIERHAHANVVNLALLWDPEYLIVTLEDDGNGFDRKAVSGFGHFGLQIMDQRAAEIGCTLEIISQPGEGSRILLRYPFTEKTPVATR